MRKILGVGPVSLVPLSVWCSFITGVMPRHLQRSGIEVYTCQSTYIVWFLCIHAFYRVQSLVKHMSWKLWNRCMQGWENSKLASTILHEWFYYSQVLTIYLKGKQSSYYACMCKLEHDLYSTYVAMFIHKHSSKEFNTDYSKITIVLHY